MCLCPLHPTPRHPRTLPPSTADKHMWADNMTLPVKSGRDKQRERREERGRTRSFGSPDIFHSDSWWRQIRLTHAHNCQPSPTSHPSLSTPLLDSNPSPIQKIHAEAFLHFSPFITRSPPPATQRVALTCKLFSLDYSAYTLAIMLKQTERDTLWNTFFQGESEPYQ